MNRTLTIFIDHSYSDNKFRKWVTIVLSLIFIIQGVFGLIERSFIMHYIQLAAGLFLFCFVIFQSAFYKKLGRHHYSFSEKEIEIKDHYFKDACQIKWADISIIQFDQSRILLILKNNSNQTLSFKTSLENYLLIRHHFREYAVMNNIKVKE